MLLSAQILADVCDVNRFRVVNQVSSRAGSTIDVFFRLVDRDTDRDFVPAGRRFIPAANSTLVVSVKSVTPRKQLAFQATCPFPDDRSIWYFRISPDDGKVAPAPGGGPIIDWSNLVPIGEPFDFNSAITDYGMVGTLGLVLTLTENPGYSAQAGLLGVAAGDQVTINGVVFTAVTTGATGAQFDVGGTDAITATNLAAVVNSNSAVAQVTAVATNETVVVTAVRAASIAWTGSASFTLSTPAMSGNARVTTGWAPQALSIAPSIPTV
jgi:hypothetical protein